MSNRHDLETSSSTGSTSRDFQEVLERSIREDRASMQRHMEEKTQYMEDRLKLFNLENELPDSLLDVMEFKSSDKEDDKQEQEKLFSYGDETQMLPDNCLNDPCLADPLAKYMELLDTPEVCDKKDEKMILVEEEKRLKEKNGIQQNYGDEFKNDYFENKNNNEEQFCDISLVDDDNLRLFDEFLGIKSYPVHKLSDDDCQPLLEPNKTLTDEMVENRISECVKIEKEVPKHNESESCDSSINLQSPSTSYNGVKESPSFKEMSKNKEPALCNNAGYKRMMSEIIELSNSSGCESVKQNTSNSAEETPLYERIKRNKKKKNKAVIRKNSLRKTKKQSKQQDKQNKIISSPKSWRETGEDEDDKQWEDIEGSESESGTDSSKATGMDNMPLSMLKKSLTRDLSNGSSSTSSSIEAFLPKCIGQWNWKGSSFFIKEDKTRIYKKIQRKSEIINVGDSAVFISTGRQDCPLIGKIVRMWQDPKKGKMVSCCWYYHEEETKGLKKPLLHKGGLFLSEHQDDNDLQTISHRCRILTLAKFLKRKPDPNEPTCFYHAGTYNFRTERTSVRPNVPQTSECSSTDVDKEDSNTD